jgi:hypothetical protein
LPDKRQLSKSTRFRKLALFVSVYDDKFYLTTNYSKLITIRSHFPKHLVLGIFFFKQETYKVNSKCPMAAHAYRDRSSI